MNPEDIKKALEFLWNTGELLATTAFKLAYRKAIYFGIMDLIIGVIVFLFILFFVIWLFRIAKYEDDEVYPVAIVLSVADVLILIFSLTSGLDWLINPELGAIKILTDMFIK